MDVVFIERIFPLYRKPVYDLIYGKKKFSFFHCIDQKSAIKQTKAEYSVLINSFRYNQKESGIFLFFLRKLVSEKPKIVIHEFSAGILSKPLLVILCKLLGIKLIFWGHMYDRTKGFFPQKKLTDKYRLWLWRMANSLITYSEAEKQLLIENKIASSKIFVALNTVDTSSFLKVRDKLEKTGKEELKKKLNIHHKFNLVFIGRLYKEKQPELLLDLLAALKQRGGSSVAVHYIGSGEMVSSLKERSVSEGFEHDVFFHGAIYDENDTGQLLFCSDLMIMPGCVGLSVNHAFCFNCPVVTFEQIDLVPAHGPEVEYIINNKTGFLIPDHSVDSLTNTVATYLRSDALRENMQKEIKNFIEKNCSIEKMAEGVIDAINYNLGNTKKGA